MITRISTSNNAEAMGKALDKAESYNKGIFGFFTRLFMGKRFTETMGGTLSMAREMQKQMSLVATGQDATGVVLEIADTGALVNYDPVVQLKMRVTSAAGITSEQTHVLSVSKLQIPRVGDTVRLKVDPSNPNFVAYAGLAEPSSAAKQ